jgi:hypothetical protein
MDTLRWVDKSRGRCRRDGETRLPVQPAANLFDLCLNAEVHLTHPSTLPAAESRFLRKPLATYVERQVKLRRTKIATLPRNRVARTTSVKGSSETPT